MICVYIYVYVYVYVYVYGIYVYILYHIIPYIYGCLYLLQEGAKSKFDIGRRRTGRNCEGCIDKCFFTVGPCS